MSSNRFEWCYIFLLKIIIGLSRQFEKESDRYF